MRKMIVSVLIVIAVIFVGWLLKDTTIQNNYAENERFTKVYDKGRFEIYCDTVTKVLYLQSCIGIGNQGYGGLTVLINKDGKPLLYEGE